MKNPTPITHLVACWMNILLRQHEEAIGEAERIITLDSNDPIGHCYMAWCLMWAGRPEEAVDFAKRTMRLDPYNYGLSVHALAWAYCCLGKWEEAADLFERSLKYNPQFVRPVSHLLAVVYMHLGRDKEARAAMDQYIEALPGANLRAIMYYYTFKNPEVSERFAADLLKAGLPGEPSGYYKVVPHNKLTGEEIRALWFGGKTTGFDVRSGQQWWHDCAEDGKSIERADFIEGGSDSCINWLEDNMLCLQWRNHLEGLKHCGFVYRNPEGTREKKDEYIWVTDIGFIPFSPID